MMTNEKKLLSLLTMSEGLKGPGGKKLLMEC